MASLIDLPNELLAHICESAPNNYDERCKTLASLAKVNRRFHSFATHLLYRDFYCCCARHLQLFGRTILSDRSLAELVKHFGDRRDRMFDSSGRGCPMVWNVFALDQALEDVVVAWCPSLTIPHTPASFSFALACNCPNLQQLDVTNIGNLLIDHLKTGVFAKGHPSASFSQLCTLNIAVEGCRAYHMKYISLLFTITSLRSLSIDMAALNEDEENDMEEIEDVWQCTSGSSTLQELTLERCGLPAVWIAQMVTSCKTLREFHLEHYYWDSHQVYYPIVYSALQTHKNSLADVRINELNGCKVFSSIQPDLATLVSFHDFAALKHLDFPLHNFSFRKQSRTIEEVLPGSLEVLTIDLRSAREGFSDAFFISLAEAKARFLPRLKSVEVISRIEQFHRNGYLPLHFCHLRRMYSSYGFEFLYFLEFVQCEFKAAYMEPLLANMRSAGSDGLEIAERSSLEAGCLSRTYPSVACNSRSADAHHSKRSWGYMQDWAGPAEFNALT
ncbi:hypothetical protein EK21DRAFT_114752 [Setomelanomma holmii]|uniref:F-box domain-containing protein n=1 Tax=Setomelanomma holmii TaxID=210430 RepID=A0A9P4H5V4_9PLEO|nr:hypothetical protein EK21DRAFT_114752 [Setomelanomma holmii]